MKRVEETAKDILIYNKANDIVVLPKTPAGKRTRKNRQAFETIQGKSHFLIEIGKKLSSFHKKSIHL